MSLSASTIGRMSSFNPYRFPPSPCWQCVAFQGMVYQGTAALCSRPNFARVRSAPENGCSGFVREVGADDEPGPPLTAHASLRQRSRSVSA